ncbi:MAG TPA: hypothetical protein VFJ82_24320 [Longimicrobium sp.]|nr:hypothetical protein [Longimicrobium sp.]
MRGIGRWLAVAAMVGTAGCSPGLLSGGMRVTPGCGAMQARSYHVTNQWATRQKVSAIQSRYSPSYRYSAAGLGSNGWKSLASGECR